MITRLFNLNVSNDFRVTRQKTFCLEIEKRRRGRLAIECSEKRVSEMRSDGIGASVKKRRTGAAFLFGAVSLFSLKVSVFKVLYNSNPDVFNTCNILCASQTVALVSSAMFLRPCADT